MYKDDEIIGMDTDGCLILWDNENQQPYNCGETVEDFTKNGAEIWSHEKERITDGDAE